MTWVPRIFEIVASVYRLTINHLLIIHAFRLATANSLFNNVLKFLVENSVVRQFCHALFNVTDGYLL